MNPGQTIANIPLFITTCLCWQTRQDLCQNAFKLFTIVKPYMILSGKNKMQFLAPWSKMTSSE